MIQKRVLQAAQQVASDYEQAIKAHTDKMVSVLKENCQTYGEIDATLKRIRQSLAWEGRRQCLPLIDEVEAAMGKEKGRLLVASSPSP